MQDKHQEPRQLTVIIPTLADAPRRASLGRAINSITAQTEVPVDLLLVVNGQRYDPDLLAELQTRRDLRVLCLAEASLVAARHQGRVAMRTPFFCYLDDDDELLPGSLARRLQALQDHPDCAMVVCCGWRELGGLRTPSAQNLRLAMDDPYHELSRNNWMTSCGGMFRSARVGAELFADVPSHHEWTYLAYRLLTLGPFCIVEQPGYVIHDTPASLSKTSAYEQAHAGVLREVLKLDLPPAARRAVRERLARAEHDLACTALAEGRRGQALKHHLQSLALPGGLRYLSFSRHLLLAPRIPA